MIVAGLDLNGVGVRVPRPSYAVNDDTVSRAGSSPALASFRIVLQIVKERMDAIHQATVDAIRASNPLEELTDPSLVKLYHQWSEIHYSAGWVRHNNDTIAAFLEWATASPVQRMANA